MNGDRLSETVKRAREPRAGPTTGGKKSSTGAK